jgi:hypothetical protein
MPASTHASNVISTLTWRRWGSEHEGLDWIRPADYAAVMMVITVKLLLAIGSGFLLWALL